jgi:predicted RNase H-like HicB family nuclease
LISLARAPIQLGRRTWLNLPGRRYLFDIDIKLTMRQVILTPGEDGYWVAEVPSLPGCISQGKTRGEALTNIKEAIEGYIAALKDDGIPVPEEHFEVLVAVV